MADLRDALSDAFDAHETPETPEPTPAPAEPPPAADAPLEPAQPAPEPAPAPLGTPEEPKAGPVRDALGRFVKSPGQATATLVGEPPKAPEAAAPGPADRPPANFPIGLRDQWAALPAPLREYTVKRENEVTLAMQESARARQFVAGMAAATQPYLPAIQAGAGGDVMKAFTGLLDVDSALRFGNANEKAARVAGIVRYYGVDIAALDSALVGIPAAAPNGFDPQAVRAAVQQELSPLFSQVRERAE